jgi:trehalose-phosphatase
MTSGVAAVTAEVMARLGARTLALFCDFDGTLSPIVDDPDDATIPSATRGALARLADRGLVAVVSGRGTADVMARVGLATVHYAGAHGMEIVSPGQDPFVHPDVLPFGEELALATSDLRAALTGVAGVIIEDKRWTVSVHYRMAAASEHERVMAVAAEVAATHPTLRMIDGRMVRELRPDVDWDKGTAVHWLLERFARVDSLAIYLGDDVTDEDAFRALPADGLGIRVEGGTHATAAALTLPDTAAVGAVLAELASRLVTG